MANYDILRHYLMNSGQLIGSPIAQGISKRQDLIRDQEQQELQRRMMESQMRAKQQAEMARREHELGLQRMKGEDAIRKSKADAEGWATSRQQVFGPLNEAKAGLLKSQTELTGKRVGSFDREQGREDAKLKIARMRLRAGKQPLDPKKVRIKEIMNELRILENSTTDAASKRTDELQSELDNLMGVSDQPKLEEQRIDGQVSGQSEAAPLIPKQPKGKYGVDVNELGSILNLNPNKPDERALLDFYISTKGANVIPRFRRAMNDQALSKKLMENIARNKEYAKTRYTSDEVTPEVVMQMLGVDGPEAREKVQRLMQMENILGKDKDYIRQRLVEMGE